MIAKMSKLRLIGLLDEKEKIMDYLAQLSCVHLVPAQLEKNAKSFNCEDSIYQLENEINETERAISALHKFSTSFLKVECSFSELIKNEKHSKESSSLIQLINEKLDQISALYNLIATYRNEQMETLPENIKKVVALSTKNKTPKIANIDENIKSTLQKIYSLLIGEDNNESISEGLNLVKNQNDEVFLSFLFSIDDYNTLINELKGINDSIVINSLQNGTYELHYSFKRANPEYYLEYEKKFSELSDKIYECEKQILQLFDEIKSYVPSLPQLYIYADLINYKLEKERAKSLMLTTTSTFVLDCYVEKAKEKEITQKLFDSFPYLVITPQKITSRDTPPTLVKHNKVVKTADFVVNMYSVPKYNGVDPTLSVFFFFMIFFGFIIADIGYGIVLALGGYLLTRKNKNKEGAKKLWFLISIGGLFAIVWGVLFGSFFGFGHSEWAVIPQSIMPSPQNEPILLLLFCLLLGVLQLSFGYLMRGIKYFKNGEILAGIVNGVAWVLFLLGLIMWSAIALLDFFGLTVAIDGIVRSISPIGLYVMLFGLGVGVLCAGIGTRGFTKFTKSFSALYGIINLFSDILSYARLFGLMLSSAIIAQQFNFIALGLMTSPLGYIFGFIIILIGHAFNVAMATLSAYIHDVRLQYVEYFGKFYDGDGVLFNPYTIKTKYITLID